eukprot:5322149-Alexandrium_andersonii.AAC.1
MALHGSDQHCDWSSPWCVAMAVIETSQRWQEPQEGGSPGQESAPAARGQDDIEGPPGSEDFAFRDKGPVGGRHN